MRPALLALLLVVPLASAQTPSVGGSVTLTLEPFPDAVAPVVEVAEAPFVAVVSCTLVNGFPPQISVAYEITEAPPWARIEVQPASDSADVAQCDESQQVRFEGVLRATLTEGAPAFAPEEVELRVAVAQAQESATAEDSQTVAARYEATVHVQPRPPADAVAPGATWLQPLRVLNAGNGPTKVSFQAGPHDPRLKVTLPPALVLEAKQEKLATLIARWEGESAPEPRGYPLTLIYDASYAMDASIPATGGTLNLTVNILPPRETTPRPPVSPTPAPSVSPTPSAAASGETAPEAPSKIPGLAVVGAVGALGLAAWRRRR